MFCLTFSHATLVRFFCLKGFFVKASIKKYHLAVLLTLFSGISHANITQKVTLERAKQLLFYPEQKATALSVAINHAQLAAQISAQVVTINVQLGSRVEQDQVLVHLDCQDKQTHLTMKKSQQVVANAQLFLAKRNFERAIPLKKNRHIGAAELDESKANVTMAEENLHQVNNNEKAARLAVQRCNVVAPFSGMVSERLVSVGDYVNTGQPLLALLQQNNIEIVAEIPLTKMASLRQAASYSFISYGKKHPLELKNIVDFVSANSRSQVVTFTLKNQPNNHNSERILAGMNGMISWQSKRRFLPAHLLTQRDGHYGIFISEVQGEQTVAKFITLPHAQEGRPFELNIGQQGITENSELIIDGRHRVSANTPIIVNAVAINQKAK